MKTLINKKTYTEPQVELILLDKEISLQLNSEPPVGPGEPGYIGKTTTDYITNDPFKINLG